MQQHQGKALACLLTKPGLGHVLCKRRIGFAGKTSLLDGCLPAEDKGNDPHDQEDDKEDLGELCGRAGNAGEPEQTRNDGNDEEDQRPVQHG
jgi:hypothetical protein